MKKTFKFFAAALAIVAAASCAKEISNDNIQNETPTEETVHMTFSASFDSEGETKTVLAEKNFVHWTDEDAIKLFYTTDGDWWYLNDGVFAIDPNSNDADPTFAVFSGETKPSKKYYAVSPASGWSQNFNQYFHYSGLHAQNAVKDSFDPAKHVAVSVSTSGNVFKFQNACALLKVKVFGDGAYSIKVEGQSGEFGIGETIRFNPGSLVANMKSGGTSSIKLSAPNSATLENGATYYIVVPHVTVKNFKVSLCDAEGNSLMTKSKSSDFIIERNKVYDLGAFEVPNESVEVSSSSLSLASSNGSSTFRVVSNADWTVTSSADWLTVSPSSGAATSGTIVNVMASDNTSASARSAILTVKCKTITRTVSVTQAKGVTYKLGNIVTDATKMWGGQEYIVLLQDWTRNVWTNSDGKLKLTDITNNVYTVDHVFTFMIRDDPNVPGENYASLRSGIFVSLSTGKVIDSSFGISSDNPNDALVLCFANRWGGQSGSDIDIYKNNTRETIARTGYDLYWGDNNVASTNRKWLVYEATKN